MDNSVIVVVVLVVIFLLSISKFLVTPLKICFRLIYNILIWVIGIFVLNYIGSFIGIHIGLNIVTACVAGILGMPGIALMLIIQTIC